MDDCVHSVKLLAGDAALWIEQTHNGGGSARELP